MPRFRRRGARPEWAGPLTDDELDAFTRELRADLGARGCRYELGDDAVHFEAPRAGLARLRERDSRTRSSGGSPTTSSPRSRWTAHTPVHLVGRPDAEAWGVGDDELFDIGLAAVRRAGTFERVTTALTDEGVTIVPSDELMGVLNSLD